MFGSCSTTSKLRSPSPRRNFRICGGFFDVPGARRRLDELDSLMSANSFWNNREQAQKLIEEANPLRGKIEPFLEAEKHLEDFRVMLELAEAEPPDHQLKLEQELERDTGKF